MIWLVRIGNSHTTALYKTREAYSQVENSDRIRQALRSNEGVTNSL